MTPQTISAHFNVGSSYVFSFVVSMVGSLSVKTRAMDLLHDMFQSLGEKLENVIVIQGVVDHFSDFSAPDEFANPQHPELMGHRRLGHIQKRGHVTNAHLFEGKGVEYADSGRICKGFEEFGEVKKSGGWSHLVFDSANAFLIHISDLTGIYGHV
jgi:hypothetical protein